LALKNREIAMPSVFSSVDFYSEFGSSATEVALPTPQPTTLGDLPTAVLARIVGLAAGADVLFTLARVSHGFEDAVLEHVDMVYAAEDRARKGDGPTLIETVTYRMASHSSSDDASRYRDAKEYDADTHRERIFGGHVGEYMEYLEEEDNAKYQEHFAGYIASDAAADGLEDLYESVHAKIREDPTPSAKKAFSPDKQYKRKAKLTWDERKARVQAKKDAKKAELDADDE
jgi:hypothetical protein